LSPVTNLQPTLFTVSVESGTFDSRTRHHLPQFLNGNLTEVAEMHHGEHDGGSTLPMAARTPSTFSLEEELIKFVGLDVS